MSHARRFDHVGITVADLDTVTAFFVGLGLEVEGKTFVEGEFLDTVSGIPDSRTEIVMRTQLADGLCARTGGAHRVPGRAHRLMPPSMPDQPDVSRRAAPAFPTVMCTPPLL
jgi:catechol 2,3-dioxygenase-like lactoylglutathione lyase family enzyme